MEACPLQSNPVDVEMTTDTVQTTTQDGSIATPSLSDSKTITSAAETPIILDSYSLSATKQSEIGINFADLMQKVKPDMDIKAALLAEKVHQVSENDMETNIITDTHSTDVMSSDITPALAKEMEKTFMGNTLVEEGVEKILPPPSSTTIAFNKDESSPVRSLTPFSDKTGLSSPAEPMDVGGSIKTDSEIEQLHPSSVIATPSSYRSRTSSQSSKSSKASSPGSRKSSGAPKTKRKKRPPPPKDDGQHDGRNDFYCWHCHKEGEVLCCELCPRVMHAKCLRMDAEPEGDWFCPECEKTMEAECKETQSRAMSQLSIDQLALHLRYALQRMKTTGCEPFLEPVNTKEFTDYLDYVFHPMDLNTLENNIKKRTYGCTEAFVADVKWILHNCIIYNGPQTKLTGIAKTIVKIAVHEMSEIEVCPECYLNACRKRDNWFCEPCKDLHVLVWAKLQGFPHWPAKALRIDKGLVDARFFGQHDRAWIPLSGCYLMSKEIPLPVKNKKKGRGPGAKGGLDNAMLEMQVYIDNVVRKTNKPFDYAPPRTPLTHLDLYRKSIGKETVNEVSKNASELAAEQAATEYAIKHEALDEEMLKSSTMPIVKSSERLLNIKIGDTATDPSLSTTFVLPKKKSKVVTTSGGHPRKGSRPYNPKKHAASMLDKTIASCKASLRENVDNLMEEESTSESESSSEEESDEGISHNKSAPSSRGGKSMEIMKDSEKMEADQDRKPKVKHNDNSDVSDSDLIIDIGDEENARNKEMRELPAGSAIQKTIVKSKSRSEDAGKPAFKTKSILLNKESILSKKIPRTDPSQQSATSLGEGMKRKLTDDGQAASGTSKIRKVTGMINPVKPKLGERSHSASPKSSGKIISHKEYKEKKKYGVEDLKKSNTDPLAPKSNKEGVSPVYSSSGIKKVSGLAEALQKKKLPSSPASGSGKPRMEEKGDKSDLKSTAKMLSKKVMMTRKQSPGQEKQKTVSGEKGKSALIHDKSVAIESNSRRLSSFTIPKHKPPAKADGTQEELQSITASSRAFNQHNGSPGRDKTPYKHRPNINAPSPKIQKYSDKVMQSMQQVLSDMYQDIAAMFEGSQAKNSFANSDTEANSEQQQVAQLRLELEHLKWMHKQEIAEIRHNHDLTIAEIRQSLENEKVHMLDVAKRKSETEKVKAIEETKRKQWCANCGKEAIFYCCWNTSYCDYPCQQLHWSKHMATCSQARDRSSSANATTAKAAEEAKAEKKEVKAPKISEPVIPDKDMVISDTEDHSDTDMMVIDESTHKDATMPVVDMISPESPDDEIVKGKSQKSDTSPGNVSNTVKTSAPTTAVKLGLGRDKILERNSALTSAVQGKSIAGAVVSALTSDSKSKPLPLKPSVSGSTNSSNTSTTSVVPSKLIDDIFSKVQRKEIPVSLPVITSAISVVKQSPTSIAKPGSPDILSVARSANIAVSNATMSKSIITATTSGEAKSHSSGFTIKAIGERLLKAKQKTSNPTVSSAVTMAQPTSPHRTTESEGKTPDGAYTSADQSDTTLIKSIVEPILSTKKMISKEDEKEKMSEACSNSEETSITPSVVETSLIGTSQSSDNKLSPDSPLSIEKIDEIPSMEISHSPVDSSITIEDPVPTSSVTTSASVVETSELSFSSDDLISQELNHPEKSTHEVHEDPVASVEEKSTCDDTTKTPEEKKEEVEIPAESGELSSKESIDTETLQSKEKTTVNQSLAPAETPAVTVSTLPDLCIDSLQTTDLSQAEIGGEKPVEKA